MLRSDFIAGAVTVTLAAAMSATTASAQTFSPFSGEWIVTLKGNVVASPSFPGSKKLRLFGYPSMSFRRAGTPERFSAPDDTISFGVLNFGRFRAGPSFAFVGSRTRSDDARLAGLRKLDWTLEAGLFAEFWPVDVLRARVDVRRGFHGHRGVVADFGLDGVLRSGPWTFSAGPRISFATSRYMQTYFGVTPAESAANGLVPAYRADGGVHSAGAIVAASYRWSPQWAVTVYGKWERLAGSAGKSPIPRRLGSRDQFTFGARLARSFNWRIN